MQGGYSVMAHFISSGGTDLINLDLVVGLHGDKNDKSLYYANIVTGGKIPCRLYGDIEELTSRTIPAAPDTYATVFTVYGDHRPTSCDVVVKRELIIAWRDRGVSVSPIYLEELANNQYDAIPDPDGGYRFIDDRTCANLDSAKEYVLEMAGDKWNRERG